MEENGLSGLINIGNTCYINSIIQCLSNCNIFRDYIFNNKFIEHIYNKKKNEKDYETSISDLLIFQYYKILKYIWNGENINIKPTTFKKKLGNKFNFFDNYDQNDSHEFLQFLLNTFNDEIKENIHISSNIINKNDIKTIKSIPDSELLEYLQNDYDKNIKIIAYLYLKKYLNNNYSVINYYFNGIFLSELVCPITNKISYSFEPFLGTISIPIINLIKKKYSNLLNKTNMDNTCNDYIYNMTQYDNSDDEYNNESDNEDNSDSDNYSNSDSDDEQNIFNYDDNENDDNSNNEYSLFDENDNSNDDNSDDDNSDDDNSDDDNNEDNTINLDIYDCLNDFFKEETLNNDNKWLSPFCNKYVNAYKKITIWTIPPILTFHFKIKEIIEKGIKVNINYSVETLNMTRYINKNNLNEKEYIYELFAINNYISFGVNSGHYYSYCKNSNNNKWYKYNDNQVSEIKLDEIEDNTYILFYKYKY